MEYSIQDIAQDVWEWELGASELALLCNVLAYLTLLKHNDTVDVPLGDHYKITLRKTGPTSFTIDLPDPLADMDLLRSTLAEIAADRDLFAG